MSACGVDLDSAPSAVEKLEGALAYLELHIEQGPVLLDSDRLAAAVSGTFGVERHVVTFTGQAAHAGSTPMHLRRDSLAAAACAALEIREIGIRHGGVCTVGQMKSTPGVITAVAGSYTAGNVMFFNDGINLAGRDDPRVRRAKDIAAATRPR